MTLSSLANPRVALARRLARRRARAEEGLYLLEGRRAIADAVAAGARIHDLFVTAEHGWEGPLQATQVTDRVMQAITSTRTPPGAVAVVETSDISLDDLHAGDLMLILDGVSDPGNAGTLLRSAHAAGAAAVIFTTGSVDPYNPKTVRAAAAALSGPAVVKEVDVEEAMAAVQERGLIPVAASADAPTSMYDADLSGPIAFVLGNEAWGLSPGAQQAVRLTVGIPMPGPAESLNVAVAGSILLFEALRQRRVAAS